MEIKRAGSQPSGKGPAEWFTGTVRIDPLFQATEPARAAGNRVTFEPGARTAWHSHPLGQTLIVTSGCGWAQRWGGPIEEIRPDDVVWFPPGEKHWHALRHAGIGLGTTRDEARHDAGVQHPALDRAGSRILCCQRHQPRGAAGIRRQIRGGLPPRRQALMENRSLAGRLTGPPPRWRSFGSASRTVEAGKFRAFGWHWKFPALFHGCVRSLSEP